MLRTDDPFEDGRRAFNSYHASQAFSCLTKTMKSGDAWKLFLPGPPEHKVQVASPMPDYYRKWMRGWEHEMGMEGKTDVE